LFQTVFCLVWGMIISLALCTFMMVLSLNARQRQWQTMSSVFAFGLLLFAFSIISSAMSGIMFFAPAYDTAEFWWWNGFAIVYLLTYIAMFQQITAAQLTFEAADKSTRIRLLSSLQFFLVWGAMLLGSQLTSLTLDREIIVGFSIFQYVHWAVFTLIATTENDYLSRRIRRDLPQRAIFRLLLWPFLPGGTRGLVYCIGHLLLLGLIPPLLYENLMTLNADMFVVYAVVTCYYVIYANAGTAMMRWGNTISGDFRPAHARLILVVLIAVSMFIPIIPRLFSTYGWDSSFAWYDIISPAMTIAFVSNNYGDTEYIASVMGVVALLSTVINARSIFKSLNEVIHVDRHGQLQIAIPVKDQEQEEDEDDETANGELLEVVPE
ncbi:MAG: hypothetical protein ACKVT0_18800, partial [Planctomycetaceae bacterium]